MDVRIFSALVAGLIVATAIADEQDSALTLEVSEDLRQEAARRDVWTFEFEGNHQFTDDQLHRSLMNDDAVQELVWPLETDQALNWPADTRDRFVRTVADRLVSAYHYAGYCDVKVDPVAIDHSAPLKFRITEGPRFLAAMPQINGGNDELREELLQALTETTGQRVAGTETLMPWWQPGTPAPVAPIVRDALQRQLQQVLEDFGYDFAEVQVGLEPDTESHTVNLNVNVKPGSRILIDSVHVEGSTVWSRDEIIALAKIETGLPSGRETCAAVERRLYDSGRFLRAKAWTDAPFDENDGVVLHVDIREYESLPPTRHLNEPQNAVLQLSSWLKSWSQGGAELSFKGTINTGPGVLTSVPDLRDSRGSAGAADEPSKTAEIDPVAESVRAMLPVGLLPAGQLEYDAVFKPGHGGLVNFRQIAGGRRPVEATVIRTSTHEGVVVPQSGVCWIRQHNGLTESDPDVLSLVLNGERFHVGLSLSAPRPLGSTNGGLSSDQQSQIRNSGASKSGLVQLDIIPAALLKVVESTFGKLAAQVLPTDANVLTLESDQNHLSIDRNSGALLMARHSKGDFRVEITPAPGRLEREVTQLLQQVKMFGNSHDEQRVLGSLIQFVAFHAARVYSDHEMPIHEFGARILQDADTADSLADVADYLQTSSLGVTPQSHFLGVDKSLVGLLALGQALTPVSSRTHRWLAAREMAERQMAATPTYARYMESITDENVGPLDMLVAAAMYGQSMTNGHPQGVAALLLFGKRRLSKERYLRNVKELLSPDYLIGRVAVRGIEVLQSYSDQDYAALHKAIEVRPDNLSAIAVVMHFLDAPARLDSIRRRHHQNPAEILEAELSEAWDRKLKDTLPNHFRLSAPSTAKRGQFIFAGQSDDEDSPKKKQQSRREQFLQQLAPLELPGL